MRHPDTPSAGPQIPRSEWAAHPHYPSQVLLLGSHESLRQVSRRLIREAESGRSGRERSAIEGLYRRWIGGMRGHVLVAALRNHDDVLGAHLDLEEELVIPCLLALTPDELDDYCRLPASVLLLRLDSHDRARFAGSVLDGPLREPG